jgi:hypothetical protein
MDCQGPGIFPYAIWPPTKPAFAQSFLTQPEALSVIHQNLDGCRSLIAKYKNIPRKGVCSENISAYPAQPIDSFSEINRLYRQ